MNETRRRSLAMVVVPFLLLVGFVSVSAQDLTGFRRGDCNGDDSRNISDVSLYLGYLYEGSAPLPCQDACDANDDGVLDLVDVIALLSIVFEDAPIPPPVDCGGDVTGDGIGCAMASCITGVATDTWSLTLPTARVSLLYGGILPLHQQTEVTWTTPAGEEVVQEEVAFVEYGILASPGSLPTGLVFDPGTGTIGGNPVDAGFYNQGFWAQTESGLMVILDTDIAVFGAEEEEWSDTTLLSDPGPHLVATLESTFAYTHLLPWPVPYPLYACNPVQPPQLEFTLDKELQFYYPLDSAAPVPLLVFHHGAGFSGDEYETLLTHVASHGVVCVSVNDLFPFFTVSAFYCWGGHDEAARVLLATRAFAEALAADGAHPLHGLIDPTRVFYGGHSRGAASAIIASEWDRRTRGVVALQPTDAKGDSFIGNTNRWETFPDVPMLIVSAEQDDDVLFPYAERLLERFAGPGSFATIYGGCHGFSTDASTNGCSLCTWANAIPWVDECRYISRSLQHDVTERLVTAFLKRHGQGDLGPEGTLYGSDLQTSPLISMTSWRHLGGSLLIDDFSQYPTNALGHSVSSSGMNAIGAGSCYDTPNPPPAPVTPIDNLLLQLPFVGAAELHMPLGSVDFPLNVAPRRQLMFRIKNHDFYGLVDNSGFDWLEITVTLRDSAGSSASVSLGNYLPTVTLHPQPEPPGLAVPLKYQRFLTVAVPLAEFTEVNPLLDLTTLVQLDWLWETDGSENVVPWIGLDDIRVE